MKDSTKNIVKRSVLITAILIAVTIVIAVVARYNVEGEKNLPYSISKILVTSHVFAKDNEKNEAGTIWNINLKADNDIYIYIDKKEEETTDTIKEIVIDNFKVEKNSKVGKTKVYRPTGELGSDLYKLSEQDYMNDKIVYVGEKVDTLKNLEVRNEGGMIAFRISLEDLGNYTSNESVIYNGSLLSKIGITNKDIESKISFDLTIKLSSGNNFTGKVYLDLPAGDVINEDEPHVEITDLSSVVFKRN